VFAGALNKGFRGALPFLTAFFILGAVFSFFAQKGVESNNYPNLFYNYFTQKIDSRFFIVCLNYIFIGIGVLLISLISVNQEVVDKQNYFPVFIYLILGISAIQPDQITPQVFTNVFVLYSIYKLLDTYRKEEVLNNIFVAAFWLSVSAYITISSVISFPLFFIVLLILRPFSWREWIIACLGFAAPVFIYECIAYLSDFNQWYFIKAVQSFVNSLKVPSFSDYYLPMLFLLLLLLFISVISGLITGFGNTVKKQRTKSILLWYIFLASFGFFSDGANSSRIILTYAFPLSFFIGEFLYGIKQTKITNTILVLLFACMTIIFLAQYKLI
jgi:hypothetical protein